MAKKRVLFHLDWIVLLATFAIVGLGLVFLRSASQIFFKQQLIWISLGVVAMILSFSVNYEKLVERAYVIYGGVLSLLVVVLMMPPIRNAHSWIRIPGIPFSLQPTELMKFALVLALARHLRHRENQHRLKGLIMPFVLTLVPMALILKQPDLGSAILLPFLLYGVIYASGARVSHLLCIAGCGAASTVPMWMFVMHGYQKRRILAFLDPVKYQAREAYHLLMSLIAIGSGGFFGQGLHNGRMNELDLLPDKHTDF
ncbi:MAG: FtsW/RodA/SpoVE family cell cycle protein, partial [Planctomycetes bacterium]|nr:FtsW/RodA/SpoVE family cell cycle protein [Planctomycetota bacterium]